MRRTVAMGKIGRIFFIVRIMGGGKVIRYNRNERKRGLEENQKKRELVQGWILMIKPGKINSRKKNGIKEAAQYGCSGVEEDKLALCMYRRGYMYTVTIKSIK